jgi:hypothetical protein
LLLEGRTDHTHNFVMFLNMKVLNEVTGEWRRLHNKELYALYSSPNIIRVMKSRRPTWTGYIARMGRVELYTEF